MPAILFIFEIVRGDDDDDDDDDCDDNDDDDDNDDKLVEISSSQSSPWLPPANDSLSGWRQEW